MLLDFVMCYIVVWGSYRDIVKGCHRGGDRLVAAVPVEATPFALPKFLLYFLVVVIASVLATEPPRGGVPVPQRTQAISSCSLLES